MIRNFLKTEGLPLVFATLAIAAAGFPAAAGAAQYTERPAAVKMAHIPALKNYVQAGTVIGATDIAWIDVPAQQVSQNIITDPQRMIGMAAAWSLPAARPIRETDIRMPILAKKGTLVTMVVSTPNMTLSTTGRALENGSLGDTIRVVNTSSNKTVQGTVRADGSISVGRGLPAATQTN